jgi:hypothetical protein
MRNNAAQKPDKLADNRPLSLSLLQPDLTPPLLLLNLFQGQQGHLEGYSNHSCPLKTICLSCLTAFDDLFQVLQIVSAVL